jgi:solute carrier family 30 (zinc transporter), member 5/7
VRDQPLQLTAIDGVMDVVDPHFWNFDSNDVIGSVHLHLTAEAVESTVRSSATRLLMDAGVKRVTIQVEKQALSDFRFTM